MIYLKRPLTQQPQSTVQVDWGNPLSKGLIFAWTASKPLTNAVGVSEVSFINGVYYSDVPRDRGIVRRTTANGTIEQRFRLLTSIPPSTPLTYGVAMRFVSYHPEGQYSLTSDAFANHTIRFTSELKIQGGIGFVSNAFVTSDNSYVSGDWVYVVMTAKSGAWTMYVNGVKQSTVATGGLSGVAENRVDLNGSGLEFLTGFASAGAWTDSEAISWTRNPWQLLKNDAKSLYFDAGSSSQTLTPSLFTNSNTFYSATVTAGAVTLTPSLFTNTNTFYNATVSATYSLTPALFTNSNTFYNATVTAGAVTLTPALFTNSNTFYNAVVSQGGVVLQPDLFTNTNTFYSATITAGAVTLTPALFTNSNTFYNATVSQGGATQSLTPDLFTNTNTFYSATVTAGTVTLTPVLFTNSNTFYNATVSLAGSTNLYPELFINTNTFFGAQVINQYPDPSQVEFGVKYGPGGLYTGTLVTLPGETSVAIRSFTRKF